MDFHAFGDSRHLIELCAVRGGVLSKGSTEARQVDKPRKISSSQVSQMPTSGSFPGEPEPQTAFAVSPDYLHLAPPPSLCSPVWPMSQPGHSVFKGRRQSLLVALYLSLGAPVPRRASLVSQARNSTESSGPASLLGPAFRPSELLVFIKILLHAQSRTVCGS